MTMHTTEATLVGRDSIRSGHASRASSKLMLGVFSLAVMLCLTRAVHGQEPRHLRILCGGGIRPAMERIAAEFQRAHDCRVSVDYAGSGTLFGRLQAGVEADVFVPGDMDYLRRARDAGLVSESRVFAWFVPVIAVQKGNPRQIDLLDDLTAKGVEVGVGRADACAIGNVTRDLFAEQDLSERIRPRFEALTVNRLANQLKLDALDAAIIWDATARQYADSVDAIEITGALEHAVPLGGGVLRKTSSPRLARAFLSFASGKDGAAIFREEKYTVPGNRMRVGCGSSMRPPIEDLAALFQKRTGVEVLCSYGSSGTVLLQMQESKEGDVYICHDPFAYTCEERGISAGWDTIAYLHPVLAVKAGNPKNIKGLRDLLRPDLDIGLPHNRYSTRGVILWESLAKAGIAEQLKKRKFYESRTHDLVNQLKLDTVDVAVLWDAPIRAMPEYEAIPIEEQYQVDAITSATSNKTYSLEHVKVTAVRLTFAAEPLLAAQFMTLCLSDEGREIMKKHGFDLPPAN